jgi:lysophospholipase L1-like esterase
MPAPDRSWTIAPMIGWYGALLIAALWVVDGSPRALADRFSARAGSGAVLRAPGPTFVAPPVTVAEANDVDDDALAKPANSGAKADLGALDDPCVDRPSAPLAGAAARSGEAGPSEGDASACKRHAMDPWYRAVAAEQRGELGRAARVSWYGDSVVATDAIPGRLRARLQAQLGNGGPGFVFVVPPHRFCEHEAITRSSNGLWNVHAISTTQISDGLYGPAGSTAEATDEASATIKLAAGTVTDVELYYLAQPHGGVATLVGDRTQLARVDTAGDARHSSWATAHAPDGIQKLELTTRGRVRVFGVDLENARGAVVDNLGIVSVHVKSFAANDAPHWREQLAHRAADLVMIMIGANEAEWLSPGDRDTKDYQAHYEALLAPIREGRPEAACLVVSPTDQAEEHDGEYRSRPVMPLLVAAQHAAARAQGCAFYSTYEWMGGKGAATKWFRAGLVSSDFQHLSKKGANKLADALYDSLMAGYERHAH